MVLGFDQRRPNEGDYHEVIRRLKNLESLIEGLSLMLHGSYVRGDCQFGRSDIDATIIFPDDVVIDKDHLESVGEVLSSALLGRTVPLQITVTDLTTIRDGRFNSYNPSFKEYFEKEGKVIVGPDYRQQFRFELPTKSDQSELAFNLRKARQGLLFADYDKRTDYKLFLDRFISTLNSVSRGSKQVLFLIDGNLRTNRFSALQELRNFFPALDIGPFQRIKDLYANQDRLDGLYSNQKEVMETWNSSLTFFEELIRSYIRKFPRRE